MSVRFFIAAVPFAAEVDAGTVLRILWVWLLVNAVLLPPMCLLFYWLCPLAAPVSPMIWTRPADVPLDHPLIDLKGKLVRYRGCAANPLPKRFAVFGFFPWGVFWVSFSLFMTSQNYGISLWMRLGVMLLLQAALLMVIVRMFRRWQPKWLNQHLASSSAAGSASAS